MGKDELQYDMTPKQSRDGWPMRRGHVMPGPCRYCHWLWPQLGKRLQYSISNVQE